MNDIEIWKHMPFLDNYEISNFGKVKNTKTGRTLKPFESKGYHTLKLYNKGEMQRVKIHRYVALLFVENHDICNPDCNIVNHIDENRSNNHYTNLEWCTMAQNTKHSSYKWSGNNHYTKRK